MSLSALTFDCAGTLIEVNWNPHRLALDCAADIGLKVDQDHGWATYDLLLTRRWSSYMELNLARDQVRCDTFWEQITRDWLAACDVDPARTPELLARAADRLYGPDARVFVPFPDAEPALAALRDAGIRLAVLSNWDVSLHRVLRHHGLDRYFEFAIASLEEGVEKPDPALFCLALERLGLSPDKVGHVGDDPVDDLSGACGVGVRAWLVDRSLDVSSGAYLRALTDLPEAIQSSE